MSEFGHANVSRKVFLPVEEGGDTFWNEPRAFSRWEAWEYLFLVAARYRDHRWMTSRGQIIVLQRGETKPVSLRYLMEAWGWASNKRVFDYLKLLVKMDRIRKQQETSDGTTYLIVNYKTYQNAGSSRETELEAARKQPGSSQEAKEKKVKKEKIGMSPIPPDWVPSAEHVRHCAENRIDLAAEAEKFRLHAEQKAVRNVSWNAAFAGWLRRDWVKHLNGDMPPRLSAIIEDD